MQEQTNVNSVCMQHGSQEEYLQHQEVASAGHSDDSKAPTTSTTYYQCVLSSAPVDLCRANPRQASSRMQNGVPPSLSQTAVALLAAQKRTSLSFSSSLLHPFIHSHVHPSIHSVIHSLSSINTHWSTSLFHIHSFLPIVYTFATMPSLIKMLLATVMLSAGIAFAS